MFKTLRFIEDAFDLFVGEDRFPDHIKIEYDTCHSCWRDYREIAYLKIEGKDRPNNICIKCFYNKASDSAENCQLLSKENKYVSINIKTDKVDESLAP